MEKLIAQARVYYIIAYGRDSSYYEDKKWTLGKVYMTDRRVIFKKMDRTSSIGYSEIVEINERDKYSRISPPMGWSRGSILEIKHWEDSSKRHVLITLISADFDVITKMKAIFSRLAFGETTVLGDREEKLLLLLSLGIRDARVMRYILGISPEEYSESLQNLKLRGMIREDLSLTGEGLKRVEGIKKRI